MDNFKEMVGKVYKIQKVVETPGDWAIKVSEDLQESEWSLLMMKSN